MTYKDATHTETELERLEDGNTMRKKSYSSNNKEVL